MVHVVINSYKHSDSREELVLLDFQGSFHANDQIDLDNLEIGDLTLNSESATLVIGHHRLVGKKVKLTKPFAVIHKKKNDFSAMEENDEGGCYNVAMLLKEKYVFTNRPSLLVKESSRGLTKIDK
ncbi:MAG: Ctf8-domain-containing protein [Benjaminiella poitrasii]|nr:MAG: Ctf8-domain-containing protein [Benjaminiella poitrasii]